MHLLVFSSTELDLKLFIESIARAFDIDHSGVKRVLLCSYESLPGRGQHRELLPELDHTLAKWMAKKADDNKAINRTELLSHEFWNGDHKTMG
jgi:hypothetical protein